MINKLVQLLIIIIGIVCLSTLPKIFTVSNTMDNFEFLSSVYKLILDLLKPHRITIQTGYSELNLLESLIPYFMYSFTIFSCSFLLSIFCGIVLSILTTFLQENLQSLIKGFIDFIESLPDLLVFFLLQYIFITIYKNTGVLLFNVAGGFEKAYFIPIVALSVLPTIYFFRISYHLIREESIKHYVEFARSKGLKSTEVLVKHVLKNIMLNFNFYLKPTFWYTFSNFIILEVVFNIVGITWFVLQYRTSEVTALSFILFLIPWYLVFSIIELASNKLLQKGTIN